LGVQLRTAGTEKEGWVYLAELVGGEGPKKTWRGTDGHLGTWTPAAVAHPDVATRGREGGRANFWIKLVFD